MSGDAMVSLADFVREHGVRMSVRRTDGNPLMDNARDMDHWRCVLTCEGRRMVLTFSMGFGLNGVAPGVMDVLDCLASDATALDMPFEEWCREYGYDLDSRKALRTYRACVRHGTALRRVLGSQAVFDALRYDVERL